MRQSRDDLLRHLSEQVGFLISSSRAYDAGKEAEARRLASTLRTLLHDTKRSQSLLGLLGAKPRLRFWDTASPLFPGNLASHAGLTLMRTNYKPSGMEATYTPKHVLPPVHNPKTRSFDKWWTEIVIVDADRRKFSRRDLVLGLANQDGGSHVDPDLSEAYAALSRMNSIGWEKVVEDTVGPLDNDLILASVRQVTHEVLLTIQDSYPDAFQGTIVRPWKDKADESIFNE